MIFAAPWVLLALPALPLLWWLLRVTPPAPPPNVPALKDQVQQQAWIHLLLGIWIPYLYLVNFLASVMTRKIRWRGIRYELISAQQTNIIGR